MADADAEVWGPDFALIAARGATDRIPIATAAGAGGYSERSDFVWRDAAGRYNASGSSPNLRINQNDAVATLYGLELGGGGVVDASFKSALTTGEVRISAGRSPGWGGHQTFYTDTTEKARLTPSGNFGLGTPSPSNSAGFDRQHQIDGSSPCLTLNGTSSGRKYSLGVAGDGNIGIWDNISEAYPLLVGLSANFVASGLDNFTTLGRPALRWSVGYAGSNWVITCDVRFKTYRAAPGPTEAELRAGLRCVLELGFHQFNDAIALKGPDGARWHFGPGAQPAWQIFADEGLCDALIEDTVTGELVPPEGSIPPACLCFDKIEEETGPVMAWYRPSDILGVDGQPIMVPCAEGEEGAAKRPTGETHVTREAGNIFGVRIDQLQSLMIAALNAKRLAQAAAIEAQAATIASMEARLAALETPA